MPFRLTPPQIQFLDQFGNPLTGGQLFFYATGTSTPIDTFADDALATANANPIVLDSSGACPAPFLLSTQEYKVVLQDANGATIWTVDPVSDPTSSGASISSPLNLIGPAGTSRVLAFQTLVDGVGKNRFTIGINAVTEGGDDAGSDLVITSCNDDGSNDSQVATINRATGQVDFLLPPTAGGQSTLPTGAVVPFAMEVPPAGWLFCDGSAVSRKTYAALFAAIATTYGAGDSSTTFNLPNLQAYFVRGFDKASTIDLNRTFGSEQSDAVQAFTVTTSLPIAATGAYNNTANGASPSPQSAAATSFTGSPVGAGGTLRTAGETRPVNVALYYCIKI